ncbi:MAG: hypothetical protein V4539_06400 [Bacteroidota bacterium]
MLRKIGCLFIIVFFFGCSSTKKMNFPVWQGGVAHTGTEFYQTVAASKWRERDSLAKIEILSGNIPSFLRKFVRVSCSITDSSTGKVINAYYFVAPDYLSLGTDDDWSRIPLTPMAAQIIADSFHCFLPTRKMVNDIYEQAKVKLAPVPMYAFRDSSVTMWQHHLIVEGQRKGRKGLIAGIKKDVVLSGKLTRDTKPDREAIYGWHKLDGKPIQPLYTGHINWWVDYSHGIRLIYRTVWVNGKAMDYTAVFKDPVLQKLLCDEEWCDCLRY